MLDTSRAVPFVTCHDLRIRSGRFAEMNENTERSPLEGRIGVWNLHVFYVVYMQRALECTSCDAAILNLVPRLPEFSVRH